MTRLEWHLPGTRFYESGVDRGVLFAHGEPAVAWDGLIAVDDRDDGADVTSYYLDGHRYMTLKASTNFTPSITSYAAPIEFEKCLGNAPYKNSAFFGNQNPGRFDFSYRTMIGNDQDEAIGYKLHFVYNAIAMRTDMTYGTRGVNSDPLSKTYDLHTVPTKVPGHRRTSHIWVDSRETNPLIMALIEAVVYGTDTDYPRMPTPEDIMALLQMEVPDIPYALNLLGSPDSEVSAVRNLFTNPSFEATSGTVEVRRNLANYTGSGSSTTSFLGYRTVVTNPGGFIRATANVAAASRTGGLVNGLSEAAMVAVTPGEVVSVTAELRGGGVLRVVAMGLQFFDSSLTYLLNTQALGAPRRLTSSWEVFDGPQGVVVPAGAAFLRLSALFDETYEVGDILDLRRYTVEKAPRNASGPFDGTGMAVPDPDLTPSWTGTPNASESVLTGVRVAGVTPVNCVAIRSTRWVGSGQYSMRLIPTGSIPGSYTAIPLAPSTGVRTALATVRLEAPLTGALALYARTLRATTPIPPVDASAPNEAGEYDLRIQFDASKSALFLTHGGSIGSDDVWWDDLAVIEGEYTGPWFSGDETVVYRNIQVKGVWEGTPDASTSILAYPEFLADKTGNVGDTYFIDGVYWTYAPEGHWFVFHKTIPDPVYFGYGHGPYGYGEYGHS